MGTSHTVIVRARGFFATLSSLHTATRPLLHSDWNNETLVLFLPRLDVGASKRASSALEECGPLHILTDSSLVLLIEPDEQEDGGGSQC